MTGTGLLTPIGIVVRVESTAADVSGQPLSGVDDTFHRIEPDGHAKSEQPARSKQAESFARNGESE